MKDKPSSNNEKEKLNIAYISPSFYPNKGDLEKHTYHLAKRMVKNGHKVTVFTETTKFRDQELLKEETTEGMKIIRKTSLNLELLRNKFDLIHVVGLDSFGNNLSLFLNKALSPNTKVIATLTKNLEKEDENSPALQQNLYQKVFNAVITVNPTQKELFAEKYDYPKERIHVITHGIEKRLIEKKTPEITKEDKVYITFLNRMEWYKGVQDVIRALDTLIRSDRYKRSNEKKYEPLPEVEFIAMGRAGGYTENLNELIDKLKIGNNVKLIFSPSDEERDEYLRKSQIYILPSKWEMTGITMMEAMAKGNTLIATSGNSMKDLLIKENSFIYDFGNVDELTDILEKLLRDLDLRRKVIERNLKLVENFTWDAIFPEYEKMISKLMSE